VYLPTIVSGRVLWHIGYPEETSAAALIQSYGEFQRAASQQEPSYRVRGVLTDGFDSTTKSMRTLFPGARLGFCLRHALLKLAKKLVAIASPVRQSLRAKFRTLLYRVRQRKHLRVFALCQRLRHFADHVAATAGPANGEHVRRWFRDKKAGWYAVLADPQMPVTSTLLDQAHNALERKLFMMKAFHHPQGSQQAFLTGLAHLSGVIIRVRLQNDVCSECRALGLLAIVSGSAAGGGHRPRGPAWRAHHRHGRLSARHRVAPTACTTATTEGLSRHRKDRYGTLQ
jgi:hypothetical protein